MVQWCSVVGPLIQLLKQPVYKVINIQTVYFFNICEQQEEQRLLLCIYFFFLFCGMNSCLDCDITAWYLIFEVVFLLLAVLFCKFILFFCNLEKFKFQMWNNICIQGANGIVCSFHYHVKTHFSCQRWFCQHIFFVFLCMCWLNKE